jgi:hypothetical protein
LSTFNADDEGAFAAAGDIRRAAADPTGAVNAAIAAAVVAALVTAEALGCA